MISALGKLLSWLWDMNPVVKAVMWVVGWVTAAFVFIGDMWDTLFARLDALLMPVLPNAIDFSPFGLLNYVFPLDFVLTYLVAYCGLRLTLVGVRVIKSFVPTIA